MCTAHPLFLSILLTLHPKECLLRSVSFLLGHDLLAVLDAETLGGLAHLAALEVVVVAVGSLVLSDADDGSDLTHA